MTVDEAINILRKKSHRSWATDIFCAYETDDMFIFSVGRKGVVLVTSGLYCNINKKTKKISHDRIFGFKELKEQRTIELSDEQKIIKKLKPKRFRNCLKKEDALELVKKYAQEYGYINISEMYEAEDRWIFVPFGEIDKTTWNDGFQIFKADRQRFPIHGFGNSINEILSNAKKIDIVNSDTRVKYDDEYPLIKETKDLNIDELQFILTSYHPNSVPMLELLIRGYDVEIKGRPSTEREQHLCWRRLLGMSYFKKFKKEFKQDIQNYRDDFRVNVTIIDVDDHFHSIMAIRKNNEYTFIDPEKEIISSEFDIDDENFKSVYFQRIDHLMYSEHMKEYYDIQIPLT